ncbi:MAG TPA: hypothetical protein VNF49_01740 [Candidatus Binataceae bacterium]|nr:hypothetical protein [Candidatus Binataceae bacterium]
MADITSANAVFILTVPGALPVPTQLQGFAADDIFDFSEVDATETLMGVDGQLSGGMVFMAKAQNISFQADSPSIAVMDAWNQAQQLGIAAYPASATITLTSVGKSYVLTTGYLKTIMPVAPAKRVLQPQRYRIEWGKVIVLPVGPAG